MEGMANVMVDGDDCSSGFFWLAERVKSGEVAASEVMCRLLVGWEGVIRAEDDDRRIRSMNDTMDGMALATRYDIVDDIDYYY